MPLEDLVKTYRIKPCLLLLALLAVCVPAWGQDEVAGYPTFDIHGLGTLGAVYHDNDGARFRRNDSQPDGAPAHRLDFDPDSMLGLQLNARFSQNLEAAVQVVSRQTWEDNYQPEVTWAYLKFLPNEQMAVRLGRLGIDAFLRGDLVDVDYGNLMVRPQFSFHPHSFDGADAEFTQPWGSGFLRLKGYAGYEYDKRVEIDGSTYSFDDSRVLGLSAEYEKGGWTGRVSFGQLRFDHDNSGFRPGSELPGILSALPNGEEIRDKLTLKDRRLNHGFAALAYDSGAWQGMVGYGRISSEDWPTRQIFFSNVGYRIGSVTPYLGYSVQHTPRGIIASGFPAGLSALTDALSQVSALAQAGLMFNQTDIAAGLRYDFADNKALKVQVEHIRYKDPDGILEPALVALDAPVQTRDYQSMTLLSVAFNFVF
jgi:hypothetical protein